MTKVVYMYKRILVAYNGNLGSRIALNECIRLSKLIHPEVHLLVIVTPESMSANSFTDYEFENPVGGFLNTPLGCNKDLMQLEINDAYEQLQAAKITTFQHLEIGEPVDVIEKMSKLLNIDLVIVGHSKNKSGLMRWWGGTTDAKLTERVRCNILIAADH